MNYDDEDEELHPASPLSPGPVPSPPSRRLPAPMLPVLLGDDGSNGSTNHTSSTRSRVDSIHSQRRISLVTAAISSAAPTTLAANNANANNPKSATTTASRSPVVRTASPKAHRSLSPYQLPPIVVSGSSPGNSTIIGHRPHSSHPPRPPPDSGRRPPYGGSSSPPTLDKRPPPLTSNSGTNSNNSNNSNKRHHHHHLNSDNNHHQQKHHPHHQQHQHHHQHQHQDLHLPPIKTSIASNHQLPPLTQLFSASSSPSRPAQPHTTPIHLPPIITHKQAIQHHQQQRSPNGPTSPIHHRQPIVHPPLQHTLRPPTNRPARSTSPPENPPTPVKPSLLPPSQIPPPPPMPPPRPPLVTVPKLPPRHNTEPDPETLSQVLQETRAKLLAENEKALPEVLHTVRAILDSPAWELNGHPQAAFVHPPPHGPASSNCAGVGNSNANMNLNTNANQNGIVLVPDPIEEISVEALQPLFKAIPYASKGGKEGSRGGTDKYECLWGGCGKIVKRRDHMVNHVKAHLGIKPFACPFVYEYLDQRQW